MRPADLAVAGRSERRAVHRVGVAAAQLGQQAVRGLSRRQPADGEFVDERAQSAEAVGQADIEAAHIAAAEFGGFRE